MPSDIGIHVNDGGTLIQATVVDQTGAVVNLSSTTTIEFIFQPPAASNLPAFVRTASFITTGTDGGMQYTSVTTDFTVSGQWFLQAKYIIATIPKYTSTRGFYVYPNIAVG